MRRREFMKVTGSGMASLAFPLPLLGRKTKPSRARENQTLITIFLRGGADPLSTIVPYGERSYYEMRPTIAVPHPDKPSKNPSPPAIPIDKKFGWHPAFAPLMPLFEANQMAGIVNVGSPHPTRSHFDAQDFMDYAAPGLRSVRNGWLNRYLNLTGNKFREENSPLRAVAMQPLLPRSLRGDYPVLACPPSRIRHSDDELRLFDDLYQLDDADDEKSEMMSERPEDEVSAAGRETIEKIRYLQRVLGTRVLRRPEVKYPKGRFASSLKAMAQLMWAEAGFELGSLDIPSWDHHTQQGSRGGAFQRALEGLATSLKVFQQDIEPFWDRTLILIMSEFGRTCRENGNFGSDHGHGGTMLMLGGSVKGGKVYGKWRPLRDEFLYEGRDLPVTTDFRDVFDEVLHKHMGFEPPKGFFPDYRPGKHLGLI